MISKIKIGLIGFGYWGPNLARAIAKQEFGELVCIVESNNDNAIRAKIEFPNVTVVGDLEIAIKQNLFSAAVVATPAMSHEIIAEKLLLGKKHILVEKPMMINYKNGIRLSKIALESNLIYMPGHTFLFNKAVVWTKNYLNSGKLGKVLNIYSQRLNLGQLRKDVNVIWNLAPHDISIFDYLVGSRVKSVSATASSVTDPNIFDLAFISLEYDNGLMAHAHISWLDPTKTRKTTVIGSEGMLVIDDTNSSNKIEIHEKFAKKMKTIAPRYEEFLFEVNSGDVWYPKLSYEEPLFLEVKEFIECIAGLKLPFLDSTDGISVAKVLSAANESAACGGSRITINWGHND